MPYLQDTSQVFTMLRWTAMVVLQSLAELASEGDFCGAIVVTDNCDNIKDRGVPVLRRP